MSPGDVMIWRPAWTRREFKVTLVRPHQIPGLWVVSCADYPGRDLVGQQDEMHLPPDEKPADVIH